MVADSWWTICRSEYSRTMRTWGWHIQTSSQCIYIQVCGMVINGQPRVAEWRSIGPMPPSSRHTRITTSMAVLPQMHWPHVPLRLPTSGGINQSIRLSQLPSKIGFGGSKRITWCTTTAPTRSEIQLFHLSAHGTPQASWGSVASIDTGISRWFDIRIGDSLM